MLKWILYFVLPNLYFSDVVLLDMVSEIHVSDSLTATHLKPE